MSTNTFEVEEKDGEDLADLIERIQLKSTKQTDVEDVFYKEDNRLRVNIDHSKSRGVCCTSCKTGFMIPNKTYTNKTSILCPSCGNIFKLSKDQLHKRSLICKKQK